MAEAAVEFLLENLKVTLENYVIESTSVARAQETIWWIEDEFESIIPQFAKIEAQPQPDSDVDEIRNVIERAHDLINTFAKRLSQIRSASIYKKQIYVFKLGSIIKELHKIKSKIPNTKDMLSRIERYQLLPNTVDDQSVPSRLRNCIYYFLLFPADFQIPARRLIVLWVAEGLIQTKKYDTEPVEQIAERYLNELINLGVIRSIDPRKRNGKVKACQFKDDATRLTWLTKAKEAKFLPDSKGGVRRLVDRNEASDTSSFIQIHGNPGVYHSVSEYRDVVSFLSFETREGSKPGEDIGDFLHKCIRAKCFLWLKVLDLERVFRPKLPKTLGDLIALKYLGLRWTYLEELPKFVNELLSLELLDVKNTYISVLPKSIWRMEYLRHLYLSEAYRTKFPDRPSKISLDNLQTLWGAFIDADTCVEEGLDTLRSIRKLGLSCRSKPSEMETQLKAVDKWISNLKFLESLRLKSRDERGRAAPLHLSSLERNRNLSTVYLLGKLNPKVVCEFPVSLTDITLSGSELDLDPMKFLSRLPNLQSLRLLAMSVKHERIRCSRRGFPLLKVFYIWKLENLVEMEVEEGSLPCLEELEIRSCDKLTKFPDSLQHVRTLKKFTLTSIPVASIDTMNWESLRCLEELEIRSCDKLTKFPDSLQHARTLKKFTLTSIPVESIDAMNWESLPCLEELEITSCDKLTKFPDSLQHVRTLKKFTLTSIPVASIDAMNWESLPCLEELEIRSCDQLERLPDGLKHVSTLKEFRLTTTPDRLDAMKKNQSQLLDDMKHVLKIDIISS